IAVGLPAEPQTLAQLQHTNIVPVYSVHQAGLFQAVCMPYFGPVTLAGLLAVWKGRPAWPEKGRELVATLLELRERFARRVALPGVAEGRPAPTPGGARSALGDLAALSYPEAVLWLGARLAEGLAHAHERGIVHRDLKPANVLLTDDGQPMLLDFNLSEDTKLRSTPGGARVGGTLPYMAPEQLEAFRRRPGHRP